MNGGLIKMIKPIKVFTEKNHGESKDWRNYLIHPIRSYWGDGTSIGKNGKKILTFIKHILCYLINHKTLM